MENMQLRHLAEAEKHVVEGRARVARQRELVAEFEQDGHNTIRSEQVLEIFEMVQRAFEDYLRLIQCYRRSHAAVTPLASSTYRSCQRSLTHATFVLLIMLKGGVVLPEVTIRS